MIKIRHFLIPVLLLATAFSKPLDGVEPKWKKNGQVVFLGDSITDFFDSDGIATWNEFYAPVGAVDVGVSGDRTTNTIDRINNGMIDNLNAYLAVLKIGTNDLSANVQELTIANNIKTILDLIKSKNPGVKILLLGILPRNGEEIHQRARNVNNAIATLIDSQTIFYLDMDAEFSDALGVVKPGLFTDGLHLTAEGYSVWAQTMNPYFDALLNRPFPAKVVMLGDSLTDQWRTTGKHLFDSYYLPIETVNFGVSGHTTTQTLKLVEDEGIIDGLNAKVATLLIGGNDLTSGASAAQVITNIQRIVGQILLRLPHGRVLLLGLLPAGGMPDSVIEQGKLVNEALALMDNGDEVRYLDMRAQFSDENENIYENLYVADQTHLSVEGYAVWLRAMDPLFRELENFQ